MNIKIDRAQLLERLRAKQAEFRAEYEANLEKHARYEAAYEAWLKENDETLRIIVREALKNKNNLSLNRYGSGKTIIIQLEDINITNLPQSPKTVTTPSKSKLDGITAQIMKLEMSNQEVISVADKDNYFQYLV